MKFSFLLRRPNFRRSRQLALALGLLLVGSDAQSHPALRTEAELVTRATTPQPTTMRAAEPRLTNSSVPAGRPAAVATAAQPPTDIYLLIGQSNMAGRGEIGPLDEAELPGVQLYNGYRWVPAVNPLNRYSSVRKDLSEQQMGPGYTFGRKVAAVTGRRVGLVVNARGGTNIGMWQPGQRLYEEAVKQARKALAEGGTLKGILWHQGEANSSKSDTYLADFRRLITGLRADLGADVPVIVGGLGPWRSDFDALTNVLRAIPNSVPKAYYVSSAGLTPLGGDTSNPHFNGLSQRVLGERYADQVLEKVYRRSAGVVTVFTGCGYQGYSTILAVGSYTREELEKHGILNNATASVKVQSGYKVELFTSDFKSTVLTLKQDKSCLNGTNVAGEISYIRVSADNSRNSRAAESAAEVGILSTAALQLSVYPNPVTTEQLTLDLKVPREQPVTMQLFNAQGQQQLPTRTLAVGRQQVLLPLAQLPNGVYLLVISQVNQQKTQRVTIAR